jgi:hypothetical protein
VGSVLCLAVPPESRCSEVAVASVLLHFLGLLVLALRSAALITPALLPWLDAIQGALIGLMVLEKGLFFLLMYRLGSYLNRRDVSRRAWSVPATLLTLAGVVGLAYALLRTGPEEGLRAASSLMIATFLALLVVAVVVAVLAYVRYLALLRRGRQACTEAA